MDESLIEKQNGNCANTVLPAGADFGNGIVLYNEDCLQALRKLNDKQFNLAITDPPYNVGRKYNTHDDSQDASDYEQWCKDWLNELLRVRSEERRVGKECRSR